MGICCSSGSNQLQTTLAYGKNYTLKIREKDLKGKTILIEDVSFSVPSPINQNIDKFLTEKTEYFISTCILPSIDPRKLLKKDCQDGFCYALHLNSIFLALFDGHGKEGKSVVEACKLFMPQYFLSNFSDFPENPELFLTNLIIECNSSVCQTCDCELSGCTALLVIITDQGFHVASVGDSRAVLGTVPGTPTPEEKVLISNNPYSRQIEPIRELRSLTLSVDQKPNNELEYRRILESGGIVQQITTAYGHNLGPFRVWKPSTPYPGLSMSRSIGDTLAKSIGVIANPIYHFFPYHKYRDHFLIMASDGLWDVFENIEAVNFTEMFRKKTQKTSGEDYPAGIGNSSIARLLVEEARYRWMGICEEDDCLIDDISAVVIEISPLEPVTGEIPVGVKRKCVQLQSLANVEMCYEFKSGVLRGDILRGSFVPGVENSKLAFNTSRGFSF